jgi:putative transposase
MEVMPDHVHMLIDAPPKYAPSKIAQIFKGISSRRLRQEFLDVIKRYHLERRNFVGSRLLYTQCR